MINKLKDDIEANNDVYECSKIFWDSYRSNLLPKQIDVKVSKILTAVFGRKNIKVCIKELLEKSFNTRINEYSIQLKSKQKRELS